MSRLGMETASSSFFTQRGKESKSARERVAGGGEGIQNAISSRRERGGGRRGGGISTYRLYSHKIMGIVPVSDIFG